MPTRFAETVKTRDIRGLRRSRGSEGEIAELARRQHGVVARHQLLDLGLGEDAIERRLALGRLHRLLPGVYVVGHRLARAPPDRRAGWLAGAPHPHRLP
ncbi:MAG TPA: type IV toxin-antitoxin system AbiEi family antitoxin domain-containing protein [Solirubrobacterales bacterium]|nr:type IV toxin-antitoxin system AbiEi family antitoxin domain-containing protein [Solirubrobacterales bacterium]